MTLHIQLLGDFDMTYNGESYTVVDSVRLQSLLAYLLLHHQAPQPRQHLAFQLWPDSTEDQARNNLRKALYQLRHRLPDADRFLQVNARTVQWRPDLAYTFDVAEFESRLRQGAALSDDPPTQLRRDLLGPPFAAVDLGKLRKGRPAFECAAAVAGVIFMANLNHPAGGRWFRSVGSFFYIPHGIDLFCEVGKAVLPIVHI